MAANAIHHDGPPYAPRYQALGGVPTVLPDVPINIVFLVLFLAIGIGHGYIFHRNRVEGRKFLINIMVAAFCLTRVIATSLRMAWACQTTNVQLAIAASIFLYAGIILLYLANLFFAQRILRGQHPPFGWCKPVSIAFVATFVITGITIICLIAAVITSFYTRDPESLHAVRKLQQFGATMLAIVAILPLLIVAASSLARKHPHIRMTKTTDKFGSGSMRSKIAIVMGSSVLLSLGAWYRAGSILSNPVPIRTSTDLSRPAPTPGYLSKPAFYIFLFTIELSVCLLWLLVRVDNRFHIPDGAHGPFSYAGGFVFAGEPGNEKTRVSANMSAHQNFSRPTSTRSRPTSISPEAGAEGPISPLSHRSSWAGSLSSKASRDKQTRIENRVSWGGVSREDVRDATDEQGKVLRYQAFASSWTGGDTAADTGVEGVEREMGWDPESGKWAIRPITSGSPADSTSPE